MTLDDLWTRLAYPAVLLAGGLIGWVLKTRLAQAELKKLGAETVSLAGENLKRLQEARASHDECNSRCSNAALKLYQLCSLNGPWNEIQAARDELCRLLMEESWPAYVRYVEMEMLSAQEDRAEIESFVTEEVLGELRRFRDWIGIVNSQKFIKDYGLSPLVVDKSTLRDFRKLRAHVSDTLAGMLSVEIGGMIEDGQKAAASRS